MNRFTRRHLAIGTLTLALGALAVVAGITTAAQPVQAQPNPLLLQSQPPASCVCAPPVAVFGGGGSGGPQIANCQCGALNCAAATGPSGVVLQCSR